jgi:hypothetical protein
MAIGWLAILQNVPWADVIKNAPKVAEGAKKLWDSLVKNTPPDALTHAGSASTQAQDVPTLDTLHARLSKAEVAVSELHKQMLKSSELIEALAEQNTLLIARAEANRVRLLWLAGATIIIGIAAVSSLVLIVLR